MSDRGKTPDNSRRPPPGARRKQAAPGGTTPAERKLARYIRASYAVNRSAFESLKAGGEVVWKVPKRYDGVAPRTVDPQDAGKEVKNVWYEMARWFIRQNLDAVSFIQYVFARQDLTKRVPEPPQVCNEVYLTGYREYVEKGAIEIISNAFEAETRVAHAAFQKYRDMFGALGQPQAAGTRWTVTQNVLLDRSLPLSYLFRYILALSSAKDAGQAGDDAAKLRFLGLAARFYDRAVIQFSLHREAYAEHWKRWLPKTFPEDADRRYAALAHNEETGDEDEEIRRQG